jgi:hypothetical protein
MPTRPGGSSVIKRLLRRGLLASLLLLTAGREDGCNFTLGPNGLCAALRLDPAEQELRVGDGFRVRINADGCTAATGCPCADSAMASARWQSADATVASVDGNGVVTARTPGSTDIILTGASGSWQRSRIRVTVVQ